jgi:hypothetical protein
MRGLRKELNTLYSTAIRAWSIPYAMQEVDLDWIQSLGLYFSIISNAFLIDQI